MTKIYLAGRFSRQGEFKLYRCQLEAIGLDVCSTWLDEDSSKVYESLTPEEKCNCARKDKFDVERCNLFVLFTEEPRATLSNHNRLVELGIAIANMKPVLLVGPRRETLFSYLPNTVHVEEWDQALEILNVTYNLEIAHDTRFIHNFA